MHKPLPPYVAGGFAHASIQTGRLLLEPWAPAHTPLLMRLSSMPETTQGTGRRGTGRVRDRLVAGPGRARRGFAREGSAAVRDQAFGELGARA